MLASVNLNYHVYVEPNERTFELYAEHYAPDRKEEYIKKLKERVIYAEVRGELKPLLQFQIFQFLEIFGKEMAPFTTNTAFEHNQAFFELNELCPAFKDLPTLPEPTNILLPPNAHMVIDTKFPDSSTVRVKYEDYDHEFSYVLGTMATSKLDPNPNEDCTEGIHFFATYEQAVNWGLANFGSAAEYMGEV
jgi:hypothetical protein